MHLEEFSARSSIRRKNRTPCTYALFKPSGAAASGSFRKGASLPKKRAPRATAFAPPLCRRCRAKRAAPQSSQIPRRVATSPKESPWSVSCMFGQYLSLPNLHRANGRGCRKSRAAHRRLISAITASWAPPHRPPPPTLCRTLATARWAAIWRTPIHAPRRPQALRRGHRAALLSAFSPFAPPTRQRRGGFDYGRGPPRRRRRRNYWGLSPFRLALLNWSGFDTRDKRPKL